MRSRRRSFPGTAKKVAGAGQGLSPRHKKELARRVAGERKCLETVFYCSIFTSAKKETELPPRDGRWTYSFR